MPMSNNARGMTALSILSNMSEQKQDGPSVHGQRIVKLNALIEKCESELDAAEEANGSSDPDVELIQSKIYRLKVRIANQVAEESEAQLRNCEAQLRTCESTEVSVGNSSAENIEKLRMRACEAQLRTCEAQVSVHQAQLRRREAQLDVAILGGNSSNIQIYGDLIAGTRATLGESRTTLGESRTTLGEIRTTLNIFLQQQGVSTPSIIFHCTVVSLTLSLSLSSFLFLSHACCFDSVSIICLCFILDTDY
jgi:chromosome segregation ATPase